MASLIFEPLGNHHDRNGFACGNAVLDDFLRTKARKERDLGYCTVFVMVDPAAPTVIAGYYSLSAHTLDISALDERLGRKIPKYPLIPVTLIGRLARAQTRAGTRIGEALLFDALRKSLRGATKVGSYAVVVDAIDSRAADFYRRHDFIPVKGTTNRLFLPMETIRKLGLDQA